MYDFEEFFCFFKKYPKRIIILIILLILIPLGCPCKIINPGQRVKSLQATPMIIQLEAIRKWNGVLPNYMGGNGVIPFLNITK